MMAACNARLLFPSKAAGLPGGSVMSDFYDRMASLYHLIFDDWDASIERQARQLSEMIRERFGAGRRAYSMSRAASAPRRLAWRGAVSS